MNLETQISNANVIATHIKTACHNLKFQTGYEFENELTNAKGWLEELQRALENIERLTTTKPPKQ